MRKISELDSRTNKALIESGKIQESQSTGQITAKIISSKLITRNGTVGGNYLYTWIACSKSGELDTRENNVAVNICEVGRDFTNSPAPCPNGTYVIIKQQGTDYFFEYQIGDATSLVDLTHTDSSNDTKGWKQGFETNNGTVTGTALKGVKIRYLTRQHYDSSTDRNYEYYTELVFDDKGVLNEAKQVVTVNGFQTTLHT